MERSVIASGENDPRSHFGQGIQKIEDDPTPALSTTSASSSSAATSAQLHENCAASAFAHRRRGATLGTIGATRDNRGTPPRARARSAHSRRMRYRPPRQHQRQHQHHRRRTMRPGTEDGHPSRRTCLDGSDDRGVVMERAVANGCGGNIVTGALTQGT